MEKVKWNEYFCKALYQEMDKPEPRVSALLNISDKTGPTSQSAKKEKKLTAYLIIIREPRNLPCMKNGEQVSPKTLFDIPTTQLNDADFLFHPLLKVVKARASQSHNMCRESSSQSSQDTITPVAQG